MLSAPFGGLILNEVQSMAQKNASPNNRQKQLIRSRGLNPNNYTVVKELNYTLFLKDKRFGIIKIINKLN